jgi:hypothetical protein
LHRLQFHSPGHRPSHRNRSGVKICTIHSTRRTHPVLKATPVYRARVERESKQGEQCRLH